MSILRAYVVKIFDDIFTNDKRNQTSLIGSMFRSNLVRIMLYWINFNLLVLELSIVSYHEYLFSLFFQTNNTNLFNDSIPNEISNCDSGVRTSNNAYLSAIVIGVVRTVSSLLLSQLLRNYRRRFMYFVSAIATILSLVSFATCDLLIENDFMFNGNSTIFWPIDWVKIIWLIPMGIESFTILNFFNLRWW